MRKPGSSTDGRLHGFTLVELLVVVVIMATLLVIALPAFQTVTRQGIKSAVPSLTTTIRLARQYAATRQTDVWIVFPDQGINYSTVPALHGQVLKALRSYAVLAKDRESGNIEYITDWRYLPEGIYFDDAAVTPAGSAFEKNVFASIPTNNFPFPSSDSATLVQMPAMQYRPDGKSYNFDSGSWRAAKDTYIYLTGGRMLVNTNDGSIVDTFSASSGTNLYIRIWPTTGQLDIDDNSGV